MGMAEKKGSSGGARGARRYDSRARKRLKVRYGTETLDREATTHNVSAAGVYLKTERVLAPGTPLNLEILTDDGTFRLHGVVAWAKQVPANLAHLLHPGMGVQLIDPPSEWSEFCLRWKPE